MSGQDIGRTMAFTVRDRSGVRLSVPGGEIPSTRGVLGCRSGSDMTRRSKVSLCPVPRPPSPAALRPWAAVPDANGGLSCAKSVARSQRHPSSRDEGASEQGQVEPGKTSGVRAQMHVA